MNLPTAYRFSKLITALAVYLIPLCSSSHSLTSSILEQGQETTGVDLHEIKEEEQLFTQFRLSHFAATMHNKTAIKLTWVIKNATNSLDSDRVLIIAKISRNGSEHLNTTRITMSNVTCHVLSKLQAKCSQIIPVDECTNYRFQFGSERNIANVTTIGIIEISGHEIMPEDGKTVQHYRWSIDCNADFITPVPVKIKKGDRVIENHILSAECENKMCTSQVTVSISPCTRYSVNIGEKQFFIQTPPNSNNLTAVKNSTQYVLQWYYSPVNCENASFLMLAEEENSQTLIYKKLPLDSASGYNCAKGSCEYSLNIDPCKTYWVKIEGSDENPLNLFDPYELNLNVYNVSTGTFGLEWSVPIQCSNRIQSEQMIVEIDGERFEINVSSVSSECNIKECILRWIFLNDLAPCKNHTVTLALSNNYKETFSFETWCDPEDIDIYRDDPVNLGSISEITKSREFPWLLFGMLSVTVILGCIIIVSFVNFALVRCKRKISSAKKAKEERSHRLQQLAELTYDPFGGKM